MLIRFWFEFKRSNKDHNAVIVYGCGVTAYNKEDAITIMQEKVFKNKMPTIEKVIENVNIFELDEGHVIPNIGNIFVRGIWFPQV